MPAPMRFAYRELATPAMGWVVAGISLGLLAIVAALGPMDTLRTLTLVRRLAYFGLVALLEVPVIFAFGFSSCTCCATAGWCTWRRPLP